MLTLNHLFKLVNDRFPNQAITIDIALITWANDVVYGQELLPLLDPCGMSLEQFSTILEKYMEEQNFDKTILSRILSQDLAHKPDAAALLLVLCQNPHNSLTRILAHNGLDINCLKNKLAAQPAKSSLLETVINETETALPYLSQYGRNLTSLAQNGAFDQHYNRPVELQQLTLVLSKTQKKNVILTGPAGTGKTTLVELLARSIAYKSTHISLHNTAIYEICMSKLVAGTMYRGQFEERLENLIQELSINPEIVLFMDEIHLLWGAGRTNSSAMDAANILKPYLANGEIRLIGATTTEEYHQYLTQDRALARRFEIIPLAPPSGTYLFDLVQNSSRSISQKSGVEIPGDAVTAAIELSNSYLVQHNQPDKAINLLDMAAAKTRLSGNSSVDRSLLLEILSEQTGQPLTQLDKDKKTFLSNMEARINNRIIGQQQAIHRIMQTLIYRQQLDQKDGHRNLGTFLFAGPTGVGKTETGRILAQEFYGSEDRLLLIDMAEYTHGSSVSRLIGAAPGLLGHDQPGLLEDFLHRHGSGVIIFDEIEKAHPDMQHFLLGILDNGRVRSARGEKLSTRGCIILITTNTLDENDLHTSSIGFVPAVHLNSIDSLLEKHFSPEFLGRFDELILFRSLTDKDLQKIISLRLDEILRQFQEKEITIRFDRQVLIGYIFTMLEGKGARGVHRTLEKYFAQPLAQKALNYSEIDWSIPAENEVQHG